jgi:hypothetical protein
MTSVLNRREAIISGSAATLLIATGSLSAAPAMFAQPAGSPVIAQIMGGDLTAGERQAMIAQITDLLAEVLQLTDRSVITVLSMPAAEPHAAV